MKKPKRPKFTIRAIGPFLETKMQMKGDGTVQLKRIKKLHELSLERRFPKPIKCWRFNETEAESLYRYRAEMAEWESLKKLPENRLTVEIINPLLA